MFNSNPQTNAQAHIPAELAGAATATPTTAAAIAASTLPPSYPGSYSAGAFPLADLTRSQRRALSDLQEIVRSNLISLRPHFTDDLALHLVMRRARLPANDGHWRIIRNFTRHAMTYFDTNNWLRSLYSMFHYKMILIEENNQKEATHLRLIYEDGQSVLADILSAFDYLSPDELIFTSIVVNELFERLNRTEEDSREYLNEFVSEYTNEFHGNNYPARLNSAINLFARIINDVFALLTEPTELGASDEEMSGDEEAAIGMTPSQLGRIVPPPTLRQRSPILTRVVVPRPLNEATRAHYPSLYRIYRRVLRFVRMRENYATMIESIRTRFDMNVLLDSLDRRYIHLI